MTLLVQTFAKQELRCSGLSGVPERHLETVHFHAGHF